MHVTRTLLAAVLLVVAMVGVPLAAVAAANAARPVIPAEPVAAGQGTAADLPAMPDPPTTIRPLTTWFDRLPVVDAGSDAAPRPFLAGYREVTVGDRAAALALIDVAFDEIDGRSVRAGCDA